MATSRLWRADLSQPPRIVGIGVSNRGNLTAEEHRYPHLNWGIGLVGGRGWIRYEDHDWRFDFGPGCAVLTPPGHTVVVHFEPHFRNHHCQFQLPGGGKAVSIAPVIDLGERFAQVDHLMIEAIGCFGTQPARAQALLWHLLWELTESAPAGDARAGDMHPALRRATRIVELQMHGRITAAQLARQVGVSYATLIRLFREHFNDTIVGYVRGRRVARARDLLLHTGQPIKDIADEVGIPDLQLFNKTIRRVLGRSPREVRRHKR